MNRTHLVPGHVPIIQAGDHGHKAFAFSFGYIRAVMRAVNA
jgi:hypothetical protein